MYLMIGWAASDGKAKSVAFRTHWLSRRLVLIICIVSASVAVIVAVSVRFGLAAKKSTSLGEEPKVLLRPHGILNDSALAAVELPNGDRRVFFQGNSGNIRQAVYVGSSKQWSAGFTDIGVSNPKMHTPLAAMAYNRKDNFIEVDIFTKVSWFMNKILTFFCRFICFILPPTTVFPLPIGTAFEGGKTRATWLHFINPPKAQDNCPSRLWIRLFRSFCSMRTQTEILPC